MTDGTNEDIGVLAITVTGKVTRQSQLLILLQSMLVQLEQKMQQKVCLNNDTDPDGDTLTVDRTLELVEKIKQPTSGTVGTALSGTYGDLTMYSDGSYEYKANNAKSLNPGETATEYFTYK